MKIGVRARIVLASGGIALLVGLPSALFIEQQVGDQIVADVARDLAEDTEVVRVSWPTSDLDDHVDVLAEALGSRLTVIAQDGRVLADSDLDGARLEAVAAHQDRPEVRAALATGYGRDQRMSATIGISALYVARRIDAPSGPVIVRASSPLSRLNEARWRVRGIVGIALLLAIGLSTSSALILGRWSQRTLEGLLDLARGLGGGPSADRPHSMSGLSRQLEAAMVELASERDTQAAIVAAVADGVVSLRRDGSIELANAPAATLFGAAPEALAGRRLAEIWPSPLVVDTVTATFRDRVTRYLEAEIQGEPPRFVEVTVAGLRDDDGCVLVLHDRTRERAVERMRRDFVANVSHELKTPVAVIAATSESLLEGGLEDPTFARPSVEATHRQALRLSRIVADLLSLARLDAGGVPMQAEPVPARTAAEKAAQYAIARHPERTVDVDVPDDLVAYADPNALDHALSNLAENALQHTPAGTSVCICGGQQGDRMFFEVRDRGPGIAPEHRDRVFERFYRVDAGRSRERGGTGLGLAIVRHLATAMGGSASFFPNPAGGSVFRLDLPRAPQAGGPESSSAASA